MRNLSPKDCLALKPLPSVVIIACPDEVRANRLSEKLREAQNAERLERIHLTTLSTQTFAGLLDSLGTLSLFAQQRVVSIAIPEKKNPYTEQLLSSLHHVCVGITVVLWFRELPSASSVFSQLPGDAVTVALDRLEGEKLNIFLSREVTRLGANSINIGALRLLCEYGDGDLDAAFQTLEQIALFADNEPITEHTVRSIVTVIPETEEFALLDLIDNGALPKAEGLAEVLLARGSNAFVLLAMIARNQLNRIAVRAGLAKRIPDDTLRRALNMTPWIFDRTKKIASRTNLPAISQIIAAIVKADTRLKGKSIGPQSILSELFFSLAPRSVSSRDHMFIPGIESTERF